MTIAQNLEQILGKTAACVTSGFEPGCSNS
ncbi:MAG: hypothetical protein ACOYKR_07770 [Sphingobacterium thalpophilum]